MYDTIESVTIFMCVCANSIDTFNSISNFSFFIPVSELQLLYSVGALAFS